MPTVSNPYNFQSPIGAALQNLSKGIMSGPDEATRLAKTEYALKLRRQNENSTALGDLFRQYGQDSFDRPMAMDLAVRAGYDPSKLAELERYGAANTYGAKDPRTSNAFVGAGGAYSSSPAGFDETLAENQRQFNQKPVAALVNGKPQYVAQGNAVGAAPILDLGKVKGGFAQNAIDNGGLAALDPTEQKFVGAAPSNQTPRNYIDPAGGHHVTYDGVTDAQTGQVLPRGGSVVGVQGTPQQTGLRPNVQGQLQGQDIQYQQFKAMLDHTRNLAMSSENNFGLAGWIKGLAQDTTQVAENLANGLGYKSLQDGVTAAKARLAAEGADPKVAESLFTFDPKLPALHTAADLLVFQAASALAQQNGRSISDRDVQVFKQIVGDPRDWLGNQQKFLARLDELDTLVKQGRGIINQNLRGGTAPSPAAAPAAPGAAAPPSPQPPPGAPQNAPVQGARQAPDGNWYVPDPNRPGKYLMVQP